MKYKHHTLLPIRAFQGRGSVVGGRSLRLHGGDGGGGEGGFGGSDYDPAYEDQFQYQHALMMAQRGYPRLLEDYNAQKAAEERATREWAAKAEQDAINARNAYAAEQYRLEAERLKQEADRLAEQQRQQAAALQAQQAAAAVAEQQRQAAAAAEQQRIAQVVASYKPFDPNKYGIGGEESNAYYTAALNANRLMAEGRPDVAQRLIDEANRYASQFEEKAKKEQELQQTYGSRPYGTGMGPALGYAYGMKNAEGDLFRKFDAQGNLTEFMDQHGQWQPASIFKPVGYEYNEETGQYMTQYQVPNSSVVRSGDFEPNRYRDQQGGWLGEGGWKNLGMLALTGLTAGLASAGVGAGLAGGVAGANVAESAAALTALLEGGSAVGNALQIGNQLVNIGTTAYDFLKDSNPQAAQAIEQLKTETAKNEAAGMPRDQAVEAAMGVVASTTPPPPSVAPAPPAASTPAPAPTPAAPAAGNNDAMLADLNQRITTYENAGLSRDAATDQAIKDLSTRIGITESTLLSNLGSTRTDLQNQLQSTRTELSSNITGVKNDLQRQIEANELAGLTRSQATDKAIRDLATSLGVTEQNLLDSIAETKSDLINEIGGVKTELGNQISTGIQDVRTDLSGVETNILTKIAEYELRGMTRDQALQRAIGDVSTQLGKTEQNLLDELGLTKTQLSSQIGNVETNLGGKLEQTEKDLLAAIGKTETTLGGQITGVGTQVTDLTKDFTDFSEWSKDTEEKRRRKQEGDEALGLLSQMASGSVKSGVPAEIDYFYDIGGESLFATPKQESLLPSPYEQQPEAVEGAQPKYQYYDPSGGYLFANGGMVDDYTDEDLYRILGSR